MSLNNGGAPQISGTIHTTDNPQQKVYKISWNWPIESLDRSGNSLDYKDLIDGEKAGDYAIKLEITGTQKVQNSNN